MEVEQSYGLLPVSSLVVRKGNGDPFNQVRA